MEGVTRERGSFLQLVPLGAIHECVSRKITTKSLR
jgi:hypothetical protein